MAKTKDDQPPDNGPVADESAPVRKTVLSVNMAADSPFELYPGTISFPSVWTLEMHQEYQRTLTEDRNNDEQPLIVLDESGRPLAFSLGNVRFAVKYATINLEDKSGKVTKFLDISDPGKLPLEVAAWLGVAAAEYISRRTKFPILSG